MFQSMSRLFLICGLLICALLVITRATNPIAAEEQDYLKLFAFEESELADHPFTTAPCATWENGGLGWHLIPEIVDDEITEKWVVAVWRPIWNFCGFPEPYPDKPEDHFGVIPPEIIGWLAQQEQDE